MGVVVDLLRRALPQPRTSMPQDAPQGAYGTLITIDDQGRVGKPNARLYRDWSVGSPFVTAAISIRRSQVSSADWDIVPFDSEGPEVNADLRAEIKTRFQMPTYAADSFRSWVEPIVEDILVLDAGVVEKVRTIGGDIADLAPVRGEWIRVAAHWDGSEPDEPRYFFYPDYQYKASFKNDDMMYIMAHPRTNSPVGLSPLETLKLTIDSELQATEYNRRQVMHAAPDGLLNLGEQADDGKVTNFRSFWRSEVEGKTTLAIIGGSKGAGFTPFKNSNREMQFREWQDYLIRTIAVVFGLSPQDLGITFDVNRSTSETQSQNTEDRGLRPLMALIQDYFTREIVWDRSFGGPANNLAFRFNDLNLKESMGKANINKIAMAGIPWKTQKEARIDDGRLPLGIPLEDHILASTSLGIFDVTDQKYLDPPAQQMADNPLPQKTPAGSSPSQSGAKETEGSKAQ
jgi:phage portal protein BeeE